MVKILSTLLGVVAAIAAVVIGAATADATPLTLTYDVNASGFACVGGGGCAGAPPAPVDPWHVTAKVTFDPTVSSGPTPVDSFSSTALNGGGFGPYKFVYDASTHLLSIGDNCPSSSCTLSTTDAILNLSLLSSPGVPSFLSAIYRDGFDYRTTTGTVSVTGSAPITRTYTVNASGFACVGGISGCASAPPPPVDPWDLIATVTFDPAVSSGPTPVEFFSSTALNGGGYGPYSFVYDANDQRLRIGDNCPPPSAPFCTLSTTDAILTLGLSSPGGPAFQDAIYRDLFDYRTRTGTVSAAEVPGGVPGKVPGPSTLALLATALMGLGLVRRRQ